MVLQSQAHYYAKELRELFETLKSKTRGKLRRGVLLLLHDISTSKTAGVANLPQANVTTILRIVASSILLHRQTSYLFPLLKSTCVMQCEGVDDVITADDFFICKMNSSIRLVYRSCRNDGLNALKFMEIT